jgi:hypothetical protein
MKEDSSYIGQTRWNQARTEQVKILGCYGYGSGGYLYSVTFPNTSQTSPNGLSHQDVDAQYPHVEPG